MHHFRWFRRATGGAVLLLSVFGFGCGGAPHRTAGASGANSGSGAKLTLSPASATVTPGASVSFSATVSGSANTALTWAATGGTITGSGTVAEYTAGSATGSYAVTAALPGSEAQAASAKAVVTIQEPAVVKVSVTPGAAALQAGQTQQFTATVTGTANTAVAWTATGGGISPSGLFTSGSQVGSYVVTATSAADSGAQGTATVTIAADGGSGGNNSSGSVRFTSPRAAWLYSPPTGQGVNISQTLEQDGVTFALNTANGGFSYPVQYTDGTHGCTTFTDTADFSYQDHICVPNPANGFYPTTGAWGANDGHLIVVDTADRTYFDFWKLDTDGHGHPTSTNVGKIVSGSLNTSNGTPGTTAANITGLAGDILPGELACASCIHHALNVIVPAAMDSSQLGRQGPVTIGDGRVTGGIFREGAKIRFDPSIDVNSLNVSTAVKAIMTALQNYGGLITDQTGANGVDVYSALSSQPDLSGKDQIIQHLIIYY